MKIWDKIRNWGGSEVGLAVIGFSPIWFPAIILAIGLIYEHFHPCKNGPEYSCEVTVCRVQDPQTKVCLRSETHNDICNKCERVP